MSRALSSLVFRTASRRLLPRAALTSRSVTITSFTTNEGSSRTPARFRYLHATAARHISTKTTPTLPDFSLKDKVILVTGAARGLGLVQAEALLEAGAKVYALDRLEKPDADFARVQERAQNELGTSLSFLRLDVRDNVSLNATVAGIAEENGRLDGLLACAGIQQETSALEYTMEDADRMMGVNITGTFMAAQAVARQMIKLGQPGSMVLVASMSGSVANKGLICP